MYTSDQPIDTSKKDSLSRAHFAESLAKSLMNYSDTHPFNIGITGPWGTGKTSLLNMMVHCIEESASSSNAPIVMFFNPWNFTSKEQLLSQFFILLSEKLSSTEDANLRNLSSALKKYGGLFIPLLDLTKFGGIAKGAVEIISALNEAETLESQKNRIVKSLKEQKRKIFVIIDDIDRLTFEEIRLVFRLVSSIASFPNMIFVLSFDREIVSKALQEEQEDGDRYLEKIIQVSIEIPPVTATQRVKLFDDSFSSYIENRKTMIFDRDYWDSLSDYVYDWMKTPRDINRLKNSIDIKTAMVGDEINFTDLVIITMIELKCPKLYTWIRNHKRVLTDTSYHAFNRMNKESHEEKEEARKELEDLNTGYSTDYLLDLLAHLFPVFADSIGVRIGYESSTGVMIQEQRIGYIDKFDRYFIFDLGSAQVPRSDIHELIYEMPEEHAISFIKSIINDHQETDLVKELKSLCQEMSDERRLILAKVLIQTIFMFNQTPIEVSVFSAKNTAELLIMELISEIKDTEEKYAFLSEIIQNVDENTIGTVTYIVDHIAIGAGKIKTKNGDRFHLVDSEEQFNELWSLYKEKIKSLNQKCNLLTVSQGFYALNMIKRLDEDQYVEIVRELVKDEVNMLRFIGKHVHIYHSGHVEFESPEDVERFVSYEELVNVVKESIANCRFEELTNDEQLKVAAYSLMKDKRTVESENECKELLRKWQSTDEANEQKSH